MRQDFSSNEKSALSTFDRKDSNAMVVISVIHKPLNKARKNRSLMFKISLKGWLVVGLGRRIFFPFSEQNVDKGSQT